MPQPPEIAIIARRRHDLWVIIKGKGGKMRNKSLFGRIDVHLLGKTGRLVLDLDDNQFWVWFKLG